MGFFVVVDVCGQGEGRQQRYHQKNRCDDDWPRIERHMTNGLPHEPFATPFAGSSLNRDSSIGGLVEIWQSRNVCVGEPHAPLGGAEQSGAEGKGQRVGKGRQGGEGQRVGKGQRVDKRQRVGKGQRPGGAARGRGRLQPCASPRTSRPLLPFLPLADRLVSTAFHRVRLVFRGLWLCHNRLEEPRRAAVAASRAAGACRSLAATVRRVAAGKGSVT